MDALSWASKCHHPLTAIMKLGRARTFFNITPIVLIWNKKVIYSCNGLRMSKSWGHFHFWMNYPFKTGVLDNPFFFLYLRVAWSNFSVTFLRVPVPRHPRLFVSKTFDSSKAFVKTTDRTFTAILNLNGEKWPIFLAKSRHHSSLSLFSLGI